jgi:hypothetical protein
VVLERTNDWPVTRTPARLLSPLFRRAPPRDAGQVNSTTGNPVTTSDASLAGARC